MPCRAEPASFFRETEFIITKQSGLRKAYFVGIHRFAGDAKRKARHERRLALFGMHSLLGQLNAALPAAGLQRVQRFFDLLGLVRRGDAEAQPGLSAGDGGIDGRGYEDAFFPHCVGERCGRIVLANQDRFVKFYNDAGPISIKKHLLEELPGLGKKTVTEILNARKAGPFKDFEDLKTRVPMLKDPVKLITDRIILEISDRERRHYIFIVR